jgi:hypothetical protein
MQQELFSLFERHNKIKAMLTNLFFSAPACLLLISLTCSCTGQEQTNMPIPAVNAGMNTDTLLNQKDAQGRKQGLWIEGKHGIKEAYYVNDVKQGLFRSYDAKTGKLDAFGWYEGGIPSGTWHYFDQYGRLYLSEAIMPENKTIKIKNAAGELIVHPFISHVKLYHDNGLISSEGVAIYEESVQFDFYRFGLWRFYDEQGNLLRTENYPEGKLD